MLDFPLLLGPSQYSWLVFIQPLINGSPFIKMKLHLHVSASLLSLQQLRCRLSPLTAEKNTSDFKQLKTVLKSWKEDCVNAMLDYEVL